MNWKVVLAILTGNVVFMSASYTMLIPFLPMYLSRELGVAAADVPMWSGIVFSATFVVSAVMAPIWGRMADKRGKKAMAVRAALFLAIAYFLGGVVTSPWQLAGVRVFQGFAAGLWPMDLAIMTLYAPPKKLGLCLGTLQGAMTGGQVLGPLFGGVLAEAFGMRASFFAAAAFLFLNFLIFLFVIKEPSASPSPSSSSTAAAPAKTALWKEPFIRRLLTYAVFVQMVILILQPVLTTYIADLAGDLPNIVFVAGLVFSLSGFASIFSAPLWGKIGQSHGFFNVLAITLAGSGLVMIAQGVPDTLYAFAALQFAIGLFFAGIQPSINAILASHTDRSVKGSVFGLLFSAQQLGAIAGPILGGFIATFFGTHYVFYVGGVMLLAVSFAVSRQKRAVHRQDAVNPVNQNHQLTAR